MIRHYRHVNCMWSSWLVRSSSTGSSTSYGATLPVWVVSPSSGTLLLIAGDFPWCIVICTKAVHSHHARSTCQAHSSPSSVQGSSACLKTVLPPTIPILPLAYQCSLLSFPIKNFLSFLKLLLFGPQLAGAVSLCELQGGIYFL